ncbi:cuticular protein 56F [Haematobia irritans]|uniref:cuticular protein 56F n=1 Tax=Haematobia irritans TaxID=7368 RepID=UPI003F503485
MKCFATIAFLVCLSVVSGEPPVPQNNYLPPNQQQQQPSSNYLPPQNSYQAPNSNYLPPQRGGAQAPQNSYGAPAVTGAIFPKQGAGVGGGYGGGAGAAGGYGAGQNAGYGGEENYGPAKYEFKYDVQDYESGNDFGHMESRDGDFTTGRYYVLLPDGRKQIVEYEADQNGYRPTIRYEQVNGGQQAGGRGGNYNNGGYDSNAQQGKFAGYQ